MLRLVFYPEGIDASAVTVPSPPPLRSFDLSFIPKGLQPLAWGRVGDPRIAPPHFSDPGRGRSVVSLARQLQSMYFGSYTIPARSSISINSSRKDFVR